MEKLWDIKHKVQKHCEPIIQDMKSKTGGGDKGETVPMPPKLPDPTCCQPEFNAYISAKEYVWDLERWIKRAEGLAKAAENRYKNEYSDEKLAQLEKGLKEFESKISNRKTRHELKNNLLFSEGNNEKFCIKNSISSLAMKHVSSYVQKTI